MTLLKHTALLAMASVLLACASPSPPTAASSAASSTTPSASAGVPPSAGPRAAQNLVDPAALQALKNMGAQLQALRRYEVALDLTGERVLQDGQKLMHSATADLQVAAPNRLRATTVTAASRRVLTFDGRRVALFFPDSNYYSTAEFSGTVGALVETLKNNYGIELPASDLFLWGTAAAPVDDLQSAMNAGQGIVDDVLCDHYAFRQPGIDWQVWLRADGDPLPMKLVITNLSDDARPQSTTVFRWNLKPAFRDSVFDFVPPPGARPADMVPLKTPRR